MSPSELLKTWPEYFLREPLLYMQKVIGLHLKELTVLWLRMLPILHSHYSTTISERLPYPYGRCIPLYLLLVI